MASSACLGQSVRGTSGTPPPRSCLHRNRAAESPCARTRALRPGHKPQLQRGQCVPHQGVQLHARTGGAVCQEPATELGAQLRLRHSAWRIRKHGAVGHRAEAVRSERARGSPPTAGVPEIDEPSNHTGHVCVCVHDARRTACDPLCSPYFTRALKTITLPDGAERTSASRCHRAIPTYRDRHSFFQVVSGLRGRRSSSFPFYYPLRSRPHTSHECALVRTMAWYRIYQCYFHILPEPRGCIYDTDRLYFNACLWLCDL